MTEHQGDGKPDRKHEAVDVLPVPQGWMEGDKTEDGDTKKYKHVVINLSGVLKIDCVRQGDQRARPHLQPGLHRPRLRHGPHAAQSTRREHLLLDQGMRFGFSGTFINIFRNTDTDNS